MSLDLSKIERGRHEGERFIGRCPRCAVDGHDRKRENLVVFPDGKFGCLRNCDKGEIYRMIGDGRGFKKRFAPSMPKVAPVTKESASEIAEKFLAGFRCTEGDLREASIIKIHDDPATMTCRALESLFIPSENLNITSFLGVGGTLTQAQWIKFIKMRGAPPGGNKGAWFRINPLATGASGSQGGWADRDVTNHRYALLENDILDLGTQVSLLARLRLPITCVTYSGGKSLHALVHINARDAESYKVQVKDLLGLLRPLGFDPATGNPSRLSRLPGAYRADKGQLQRLIYLNPLPREKSILETV